MPRNHPFLRIVPGLSWSALAALLIAALLFAQWIGLAHRIAHAGWPQVSVSVTSLAAPASPQSVGEEGSTAGHSCVALDAAALADVVQVPPLVAPVLTSTRVLALWIAFASWEPPPALPFSSRAPPLS